MTFNEFVAKYEGKTVGYPNNSSFYGECLSLTKWHIKEVFGINPPASGCNGARCYWSMFPDPLGTVLKKVPNTPDLIPKKGWIAVWNGNTGGGAGHIGSVVDDSATKTHFTSLDQNWGGKQAHRVTHTYDNVYGFLVPKEDDMADTLLEYLGVATDLEAKVKLQEHLGEKDFKCNWGETGMNGGFLGSEREKNGRLTSELSAEKAAHAKTKEALLACEAQTPSLGGTLNGYTRTYVKDGETITENYKV